MPHPPRPRLRPRSLPPLRRPTVRPRPSLPPDPIPRHCASLKLPTLEPKNFSAKPVRPASLATWARPSSSSRRPQSNLPKARASATNLASCTSKWASTTPRPRTTKKSSKWAFPKRENTTISPPENCATASTNPMRCSASFRSAACGFSKIQITKMVSRSYSPFRCKRPLPRKSTSPSSRFR